MTEATAKFKLLFSDSDTKIISFSPFNPNKLDTDAIKQNIRNFNASDATIVGATLRTKASNRLIGISEANIVVSDETILYGSE